MTAQLYGIKELYIRLLKRNFKNDRCPIYFIDTFRLHCFYLNVLHRETEDLAKRAIILS